MYQALHVVSELGGCTVVFVSGTSPCVILKTAATPPQVISLNVGPTKKFSGMCNKDQAGKFLYVDEKVFGFLHDILAYTDSNREV